MNVESKVVLNHKSIFSIPVLLYAILLIGLFYSCSEDPVQSVAIDTTYNFDSSRYNWDSIRIGYETAGALYIPDTSNFYYAALGGRFVHYNGTNFMSYYVDIFAGRVHGIGNNNIYIGGQEQLIGTTTFVLRLIRFNGSSFENIYLPDTSYNIINTIRTLYCRSNNEIWFTTLRGEIIKHDGIHSYKKYFIDTAYTYTQYQNLLFEQDGELYFLGDKTKLDSNTYMRDSTIIFKYVSDSWIPVFKKKNETYFGGDVPGKYSIINKRLYYIKIDGIYEFTGNNFVKVVNIDQFVPAGTLGGLSKNNLMVEGYSGNFNSETDIYHWNGEKWSIEFKDVPLNNFSFNIYGIEDKFIVNKSILSWGYEEFWFGRRKEIHIK